MVHHQRVPHRADDVIFVEVTYAGLTMIVPARRLNRMTDPRHVYILADGSLWMSAGTDEMPVFGEVLGADHTPYYPRRRKED